MNCTLINRRVTQDRIAEATIRTELVRYLVDHFDLKNAVLANEARYGVEGNRADVALINNMSHAFEIKSDFDSTVRLSGQLSEYAATFDFVTIVTTTRHLSKIRKLVNPRVGLWVYNGFELAPQKVAKRNHRLSKRHLAVSCSRATLLNALPSVGRSITAPELQEVAVKKLRLPELRELFLAEFRSRFSETTKEFLQESDNRFEFEDLLMLRRATRISA